MEMAHPRENPELFGHEAAECLLLDAYNSGKLPHAWIIAGARGLGKATLAYRFARFLLANGLPGAAAEDTGPSLFGDALPPVKPTSLAVSPEHVAFKRIVSGGHADMLVLEANEAEGEKDIPVDEVRKVGHFLRQTSAETGWRIVVIDSADAMNRFAANALLKLLEEPPANTVLLLVAHNPGRLLPTIRSRCRMLNLRPLADSEVVKLLGAGENEEVDFAIALANGSPGLAFEIYRADGLELYRDMLEALNSLPELDTVAVQNFGATLTKRENLRRWRLMTYMYSWFIGSLVTGAETSEFAPGEGELRARLLAHSSIDRLAEVWENTSRTVGIGDALHMDHALMTTEIFGMLQAAGN